jgi:hypothetical protein
MLQDKINTYFSILLITIVGSAATMIIVHVIFADNSAFAIASETSFVAR